MSEESISLSALARHFEYEVEVASLARQYYEEEGCPEGRALQHWVRAENEIRKRHEASVTPAEHSSANGSSMGEDLEQAMRLGA